MLTILDRISNRTAYIIMGTGLGASLVAAFLSPQDERLGAWVRFVIWHGMLKWACIVTIFAMGALAAYYLVGRASRVYSWTRALQMVLLPMWAFAVFIGALAAKLVWNSWNLAERRMVMSVAYTVVAALALVLVLFWENRSVGAVAQIVTAGAMGVGLWWISLPDAADVHPASAVMSSDNPAFKIYAALMMFGCLVWVLATAVPVRRWLDAHDATLASGGEAAPGQSA